MMKYFLKSCALLLFVVGMINISCRKEEFQLVETPAEQGLVADSNVAKLLARTTMNDGSVDNIIDKSSCFSIELPVSVIANGTAITVESSGDLDEIEAILDENYDDVDSIEIIFPIRIVFPDYTTTAVSTYEELQGFADDCPAENAADEDIECVDIRYPVSLSLFNTSTEQFNTVTVSDDKSFFQFLKDLDNDVIVSVDFPVTVIANDGSEMEISDLDALGNYIEIVKDSCDEDDDNYYDDDDCDDCSTEQLVDVFSGCTEWVVAILIRSEVDLGDLFATYSFTFEDDGTVTVVSETSTYFGTWSASGSGNSITMVIDVPGLPDFNGLWTVNELTSNEDIVNLLTGNDILRLENACISGNENENIPVIIDESIIDGSWEINSLILGIVDRTLDLVDYSLVFNNDGTVVANNIIPINGTWSFENEETILDLNFGLAIPLNLLNGTWQIVSISDTRIELQIKDLLGDKILILTKQ